MNKVEYIVREHKLKDNISLINAGKMRRSVNISKYFILMVVEWKERDEEDFFTVCDPNHRNDLE